MSNVEIAEETRFRGMAPSPADILVGIPTPTHGGFLRQRAEEAVRAFHAEKPSLKIVVAYPGTEGAENLSSGIDESIYLDPQSDEVTRFTEYTLPSTSAPAAPWLGLSAAYSKLADLAVALGAGACAILSPDLAAFDAHSIQMLVDPIIEKRADLCMPLYANSKYEGLLNSSILYPFSRALYGKRVRYPLGPDFGASPALLARMAKRSPRPGEIDDEHAVIWPAIEASVSDSVMTQVQLDGRHGAQNEGMDLSTVLAHLAGSLFAGAEKNAVVWQRIRGSQPGLVLGNPEPVQESNGVDVRPMLDSFHLASRNLQELWSLVLPPVTLLEIKRLGRLGPDSFRMTDNLWARIVYDFALAYRLRTISRIHLLGALTPLYLGWVASYVQEITNMSAVSAEARIEKLAKTYEDEKGYLVSRWRWPDRFNP